MRWKTTLNETHDVNQSRYTHSTSELRARSPLYLKSFYWFFPSRSGLVWFYVVGMLSFFSFFFASFVVWCLSCSYFLSTTISFCWFNPVDGVIVIIVVGVAVPLNCTMTVTRYTDTHTHTVMMTNDFSLIHWGFFFSLENHCCFLLLLFCYCCNSSYIFLVYVVYFHGQKMDKWVAIHVYDECLCIRANI